MQTFVGIIQQGFKSCAGGEIVRVSDVGFVLRFQKTFATAYDEDGGKCRNLIDYAIDISFPFLFVKT